MKYDVMKNYRAYLSDRLRPATVKMYYNRLDILLEGQNATHFEKHIDLSKAINMLSSVKYKNEFSQYKNALLHFCKFMDIQLDNEQIEEINELEKQTRKKYRDSKIIDKEEVFKSIRYIRNRNLKLSFQVMLSTGLRVSELSQITPNDCLVSDDYIEMSFTAKGGNNEKVQINRNEFPKEFENLKEAIISTADDKRLFYSSKYLQKKAKELGFQCHDLRRIFAHEEYKKTKSKKKVQEKLRHSRDKNTDIYLKARIK